MKKRHLLWLLVASMVTALAATSFASTSSPQQVCTAPIDIIDGPN